MPFGAELPAIAALAYLTIFAAAAVDIFLPPVPSDGLVVAAAALSVTGNLDLPLVVLAAAAGSWTGDLACYAVGHRLGGWHPRRPRWLPGGSSPSRLALRERLRETIPALFRRRILLVLAACRLVPGGRTIGAATAGRIGLPLRRFLAAEMLIGAVWATQQSTVGYISGRLLPHNINATSLLPVAELVLTVLALTLGVRLLRSMVRSEPSPAAADAPVDLDSARRRCPHRAGLRARWRCAHAQAEQAPVPDQRAA